MSKPKGKTKGKTVPTKADLMRLLSKVGEDLKRMSAEMRKQSSEDEMTFRILKADLEAIEQKKKRLDALTDSMRQKEKADL